MRGEEAPKAPEPSPEPHELLEDSLIIGTAGHQRPHGRSRERTPLAGKPRQTTRKARIHGRLYAASGVHYLFNPETGAYIGTRRINRTIELSADGQTFLLVAKATTFDANGNVLGSFIARASGHRLHVARISEQP